jgi:lipoprotein-releasing system permease protein
VRLPFEITIALRYMRAGRKAGVSLPTFLTVTGVMVGVAALTVVTSVWNGFEAEFLEKLLGINAHAIVLKRHDVFRNHRDVAKRLTEDPRIEHAAPFVYSEVIAQSPTSVQGVAIKGIDPRVSSTTPLARYLPEQGFDALAADSSTVASERAKIPSILIGKELKEALRVNVGDAITIISPYGGSDGDAQTIDFRVAAVFESGMFEFDSRMVFIDLREAQDFFRLYKTVTGLEVWTSSALASFDIINRAVEKIDPKDPRAYDVKDWSRTNQGLFGAVRSQKVLISIVLFIIVIVASFNIMATLILLILEKGREIAILKSLGATNRSILTIFVLDGQIVGLIGCGLGLTVGLTLCAVLQQYGLKLDPRVYYLNNLPIVVRPMELAIVVAGAMFLATIATLFPALKAALMRPVDGLTQRGTVKRPAR